MRVLFVQQDHVSPPGPVGEAFADHGYDVAEFGVVPSGRFHDPSVTVSFPDPLSYDAIVPMGAAWSVYDRDRIGTWIDDELGFLRRAHDAGVPVLGICFGAQALATAPGRPGHQGRTARGGVDPDRDEPARPDRAGAMVPVAFRPLGPAGRHPRAGQDRDRRAGLHRGAQPGRPVHPELTPQMLDGWLSNGGRQQPRAFGLDPDQLTAETAARSGEARLRAKRLVSAFLALAGSA